MSALPVSESVIAYFYKEIRQIGNMVIDMFFRFKNNINKFVFIIHYGIKRPFQVLGTYLAKFDNIIAYSLDCKRRGIENTVVQKHGCIFLNFNTRCLRFFLITDDKFGKINKLARYRIEKCSIYNFES